MHEFHLRYATFPETNSDGWFSRLRYWRDEELKATDWTQVEDAPVNKIEWAEYRQTLRDLPATIKNPQTDSLPFRPNA